MQLCDWSVALVHVVTLVWVKWPLQQLSVWMLLLQRVWTLNFKLRASWLYAILTHLSRTICPATCCLRPLSVQDRDDCDKSSDALQPIWHTYIQIRVYCCRLHSCMELEHSAEWCCRCFVLPTSQNRLIVIHHQPQRVRNYLYCDPKLIFCFVSL